ncbi:MAG: hypothetical protein EU544_04885 [Promethearchaeota archaeon]|nr:MAG: hypothetical protein EU544_04885 [Candidatus Lokiarchaeota archaeon]
MFEDLLLFMIVTLGNLVVWFLIRNLHLEKGSPTLILIKIVGIVGILIHELSHFFMCLITGVTPNGFHLSYSDQEGNITVSKTEQMTFLQGLLICIAPLLIASYIAYICVYVMFLTTLHIFIKVICGVVFVSILMHSRPSSADIHTFKETFSNDPTYSLYQIGLGIVSGIIIFLINLPLPYYLSFIHYLLIGVLYTVITYGVLALRRGVEYIMSKQNSYTPQAAGMSSSYRTRNKTQKPKREQLPRRQW